MASERYPGVMDNDPPVLPVFTCASCRWVLSRGRVETVWWYRGWHVRETRCGAVAAEQCVTPHVSWRDVDEGVFCLLTADRHMRFSASRSASGPFFLGVKTIKITTNKK
jgi:hypothetical protein